MEQMTEQSIDVIRFKSHLRSVLDNHGFEHTDMAIIPESSYLAAVAETLNDLGMTQVPKSEEE